MTIAEADLRAQDINVLTLYRGETVIPNPKASRVLQADDRLLCFGKLGSMASLVPKKIRKKRSPKVQVLHAIAVSEASDSLTSDL